MLTSVYLKNFKSYADETLQIGPFSLMIGANASGKSNALEGYRFLSWFGEGLKLTVLRNWVGDSDQIVRGVIYDLPYHNGTTFTLGCTIDVEEWNRFEVTLEIRDGELHIIQECITSPEQSVPLYQIRKRASGISSDVQVAYNNFKKGPNKPQVTCIDQIAVMCQLDTPAIYKDANSRRIITETVKRFQRLLTNTLFLDPVPSSMRGSSHPDEKVLRGNCSNLSGVIHTLCQDPSKKSRLIDFIKSLPEQDVCDIKFFEYDRGRISLELVESFGGVNRDLHVSLLSDGTLRVLAIGAALLSAEEDSTVIIEEIDNGIHPSRAKQLLSTIKRVAEERNIRMLMTTHNPALMDAIPDDALGDVVFCYRDTEKGDSRLVKLSDVPDYPGLVIQGPLGGLVTKGILNRFVKTPVASGSKLEQAELWLAKMQGGDV